MFGQIDRNSGRPRAVMYTALGTPYDGPRPSKWWLGVRGNVPRAKRAKRHGKEREQEAKAKGPRRWGRGTRRRRLRRRLRRWRKRSTPCRERAPWTPETPDTKRCRRAHTRGGVPGLEALLALQLRAGVRVDALRGAALKARRGPETERETPRCVAPTDGLRRTRASLRNAPCATATPRRLKLCTSRQLRQLL